MIVQVIIDVYLDSYMNLHEVIYIYNIIKVPSSVKHGPLENFIRTFPSLPRLPEGKQLLIGEIGNPRSKLRLYL